MAVEAYPVIHIVGCPACPRGSPKTRHKCPHGAWCERKEGACCPSGDPDPIQLVQVSFPTEWVKRLVAKALGANAVDFGCLPIGLDPPLTTATVRCRLSDSRAVDEALFRAAEKLAPDSPGAPRGDR